MKKRKIVLFHLLNDYSGSPLVLSYVAKGLIDKGYDVDIFTNSSTEGFLSNIPNGSIYFFNYSWHKNKISTLLHFIFTQAWMFFWVFFKYMNKDCLFYVNTVLPLGAALAGKVTQKKVIYHIHETSLKPEFLKKILFKTASICASKVIYVSKFLHEKEPLPNVESIIIPNAIDLNFTSTAKNFQTKFPERFSVLMLCSLKVYKGVEVFIWLSTKLPDIDFYLVLNTTELHLNSYFEGRTLPSNLILKSSQKNVHPFYKLSSIVVNLSLSNEWVETFGMTALEAMSYGRPVIVPPVGGIAELVDNDVNGYKIDANNKELLKEIIIKIASDQTLFNRLSQGAINKATHYSYFSFLEAVNKVVLG